MLNLGDAASKGEGRENASSQLEVRGNSQLLSTRQAAGSNVGLCWEESVIVKKWKLKEENP